MVVKTRETVDRLTGRSNLVQRCAHRRLEDLEESLNSDVLKITSAFQHTIACPELPTAILEEHRERQRQGRKALGSAYKDDDGVFARPDGSFASELPS
jgi:hypothetical protein